MLYSTFNSWNSSHGSVNTIACWRVAPAVDRTKFDPENKYDFHKSMNELILCIKTMAINVDFMLSISYVPFCFPWFDTWVIVTFLLRNRFKNMQRIALRKFCPVAQNKIKLIPKLVLNNKLQTCCANSTDLGALLSSWNYVFYIQYWWNYANT